MYVCIHIYIYIYICYLSALQELAFVSRDGRVIMISVSRLQSHGTGTGGPLKGMRGGHKWHDFQMHHLENLILPPRVECVSG